MEFPPGSQVTQPGTGTSACRRDSKLTGLMLRQSSFAVEVPPSRRPSATEVIMPAARAGTAGCMFGDTGGRSRPARRALIRSTERRLSCRATKQAAHPKPGPSIGPTSTSSPRIRTGSQCPWSTYSVTFRRSSRTATVRSALSRTTSDPVASRASCKALT